MLVKELAELEDFTPLTLPMPEREISGVYIGDLLSWVMGRAKEDNAWITIMSNINVIAVASLSDVSCIILTEGTVLDSEVMITAESKGINVLTSSLSSYEASIKLHQLGI